MKKENEKIDELIKGALTKEEAVFYDELEEQSFFEKLGEVHKGRSGWLAIVMNIIHVLFFIAFVYCIVHFFNTEQTNELITWAAGGVLCIVFMSMIKLYIWMQMDKNTILRELKRIELQVATLSHKTEK